MGTSVFVVPLLILAAEASASIDPGGAEAVSLYHCDFTRQTLAGDTRDADLDYDAWPDGWTRLRGRPYPAYVKIALAADPAAEAERLLRVELNGGGAAALSPAIEVSPRFTYLLEGRLQTEGTQWNEAYFSLAFFDGDDRLLERHESPRLREAREWRTVQIGPLTPHGDAVRKAVIGLHVTPTAKADLRGAVCFDDVRLARLPRLALTANSPHHVFTNPQEIVLTCEASGMRAPYPTVRLRVWDAFERVVDETTRRLTAEELDRPSSRVPGRGGAVAGRLAWTPNISQPGFYRVEAVMQAEQGVAHRRELTLAVVRPLEPAIAAPGVGSEFGWSLPPDGQPLPFEALASLASLAGVRWVKVPAWFEAQDHRHGERLARFVERMEQDGISVVGVLDRPPAAARDAAAHEQPLAVASVFLERDAWQAAVDPVMTRLTPIVRWWQLGADDDASFVGFPGLEPKIEEIRQRLGRFGQKVRIGFAWRWLDDRPPAASKAPPWEFVSYTLAPEDAPFTAAELTRYLAGLRGPGPRRWVAIQPLPRSGYDLTTRTRDLVERMLAAKIGGAEVAFVPHPFHPDSGLMNADGTPGELFPVWRTVAGLLAGSEYLGAIETPEGSVNRVFARGETSLMFLWNRRPVQESLYLGEEVRQIDLWDRHVVPPRHAGRQTIEVGPLPTVLTGVHTAIARWGMSFQFDDPRLASVFGRRQRLAYHGENPFPHGVSGRVGFQTPDVWDVERDNVPLKLARGERFCDELWVTLRPTSSSGPQRVRVDFEIAADRDYRFSVWRTIDVGLGDVAMELSTRLDEEGRLVVEQQFINRSQEEVSFLCQLFAPGRPRVRRPVLHLDHGRTTVTYHLPDGAELLGQTLLLRAEEIDGDRALNYRFEAK